MMIKNTQTGATHILLIILLLVIGVVVGVYLVKNSQTNLTSKAADNITSAFEIRDATGQPITCITNAAGIPECEIETLDFTVAVKDISTLPNR